MRRYSLLLGTDIDDVLSPVVLQHVQALLIHRIKYVVYVAHVLVMAELPACWIEDSQGRIITTVMTALTIVLDSSLAGTLFKTDIPTGRAEGSNYENRGSRLSKDILVRLGRSRSRRLWSTHQFAGVARLNSILRALYPCPPPPKTYQYKCLHRVRGLGIISTKVLADTTSGLILGIISLICVLSVVEFRGKLGEKGADRGGTHFSVEYYVINMLTNYVLCRRKGYSVRLCAMY